MTRALVVLATSISLVACSSSGGSPSGVSCGPGTQQSANQCVASTDGGVVDSAVSADAAESGVLDASLDVPTATDSGPHPADASDAAVYQSDPCPTSTLLMPVAFDCDPTCCSQDPNCAQQKNDAGIDPDCPWATCAAGPTNLTTSGVNLTTRTADAPGTDPQCASRCPSGGYVYGFGFTLDAANPWVQIQVGPPWDIITNSQSPYCTDANSSVSTTGCATIATLVNPTVYIMTRDPSAPARNISFIGSSTQPTCP